MAELETQLQRYARWLVDQAGGDPGAGTGDVEDGALELQPGPGQAGRRRRVALLAAAAVVVVAAGVLVWLAVRPASDDATTTVAAPGGPSTVILASGYEVPVVGEAVVVDGVDVYEGALAPEMTTTAQADVTAGSAEVDLEPVDVDELAFDPEMIAATGARIVTVGELDGLVVAVHAGQGETSDQAMRCAVLWTALSPSLWHSGCGVATLDGTVAGLGGAVGSWLVWTDLPSDVSVVQLRHDDGRSVYQAPVAGTVAFPDASILDQTDLVAYDADGEVVAQGGQTPVGVDDDEGSASAACEPSPDVTPGVGASGDPNRRIEDIEFLLTGLRLSDVPEGGPTVAERTDNPNFGGVWGDFQGGIVVAVLDCTKVDADELAHIAGGADRLTLIEVPYTFRQINEFRDTLAAELRANGISGSILIDSTTTGRSMTVLVVGADALPADFGAAVPDDLYTIVEASGSQTPMEILARTEWEPAGEFETTAALASTPAELEAIWGQFGFTGSPEVSVDGGPLLVVATAESGSCPATIEYAGEPPADVAVDADVFVRTGYEGGPACTADANPVALVIRAPDVQPFRSVFIAHDGDASSPWSALVPMPQ